MGGAMFGILSPEDKKLVDELIYRLTPKDDEPVSEHEALALEELERDRENGDLLPL